MKRFNFLQTVLDPCLASPSLLSNERPGILLTRMLAKSNFTTDTFVPKYAKVPSLTTRFKLGAEFPLAKISKTVTC